MPSTRGAHTTRRCLPPPQTAHEKRHNRGLDGFELHVPHRRDHVSTTGSLLRCSSSGQQRGKPSRSSARALPSPSRPCRRPPSRQPSWQASSGSSTCTSPGGRRCPSCPPPSLQSPPSYQ